MAEAEPVIRAVLPDANVPTSIRSSGVPVVHGAVAELRLDPRRLARRARRRDRLRHRRPDVPGHGPGPVADPGAGQGAGVRPGRARRPGARSATGIEGAVDRYVAMTRATQQLVILTGGPDA